MLRKYGSVIAGTAVGISLIVALFFGMRRSTPAPAATPKPVSQPAPAPKETVVPGRIDAVHTIPVSVSIAGEIDSFSADVGQDVFEGQVLARISNKGLDTAQENGQKILRNAEEKVNSLESAIIAARLEAARAHDASSRASDDSERASKEFEHQRKLYSAGATPRLVFERSEKDYETARNENDAMADMARRAADHLDALTRELDLNKKTLEDKRREVEDVTAAIAATEVHAPASGIVVARQGEIGKTITQKEAAELFRIAVDIGSLTVTFAPDPSVKVGDTVLVTFSEIPGDPLPAVIRDIRNGEAVAEFTSANPAIRPGMPCGVRIPPVPATAKGTVRRE